MGNSMKAKKYFDKYEGKILYGDIQQIYELFMEMSQEVKEIIDARHCKTNSSVVAVVREINDRWNSIVNMFEKKYSGLSPIKKDGFKNFWIREIPEMKEFF